METNQQNTFWRKCSACKKPISFGARYYICSVSTCNSQRTGYVFCSMTCFESHLPAARHRDAGALEKAAPLVGGETAQRTLIRPAMLSAEGSAEEVLIIASRLKEYIQAQADFNTSGSVMGVLSDHVRELCLRAIANARSEGRRTVMDRDFDFLKQISF